MSEVSKNNELVAKKQAIYDELEAINYHELRDEFEKRGIPSAWKSGVKKSELLKIAVQMIDALNKGEDPNAVSEEFIEVVSEVEVKVSKVDIDSVKRNLKNISLLLHGCPESHKPILRAKRAKLEDDLKELEG